MKKKGLRKTGGRNNKGRITVRHKGGGAKRLLRGLGYTEAGGWLGGAPVGGMLQSLEFDPNRTGSVGVCVGKYRRVYNLLALGQKVGEKVIASQVKEIEVGEMIYNVGIRIGQQGKIARAAGAKCKVIKVEGKEAIIRLPSGKVGMIKAENMCYRGVVGGLVQKRKRNAGEMRREGKRPRVRGVAMNAVDHPHGGKTPSGQAYTK